MEVITVRPFNLEKALAGEEVVSMYDAPVTQLSVIKTHNREYVVGEYQDKVCTWYKDGTNGVDFEGNEVSNIYLKPKSLSGFICYHADGVTTFFKEKPTYEMYEDDLLLVIDLSQFEKGHGL